MLSMTTDYYMSHWSPEPFLRRIAEAGFSHVHWCHQWNTDFLYSQPEIGQIRRWFDEFGLQLLDLHASEGVEKKWMSVLEYERLAGVELVTNRIDMAASLGSDVIIMHVHSGRKDAQERGLSDAQLRRSLDALAPHAGKQNVRIAIENGLFEVIRPLLSDYPADFLGLCYDSGHGNFARRKSGLDELESIKDRLISVHLHDNDGKEDQHNPIFSGTVDWPRLARIMAASSYAKCVSMECNMPRSGFEDEEAFLAHSFETGTAFAKMVEAERKRLAAKRA